MITLYHSKQTRSGSILWLLEELGVPYQTHEVEFRRMDGTGRKDPANPHPHGKVPALKDGDDTIFETGAITVYLTDKYTSAKLGPLPGEPKRGEYLSWVFYRPGVMEPALISRRFDVKHVFGAMGWAPADEVEATLNERLADRPYLLGDNFTAADILIGGGIHFMLMGKLLKETKVFTDYAARVTDRPAYRRMMEKDKKTA